MNYEPNDFVIQGTESEFTDQIISNPVSYWKITLRRFVTNRVALVSAFVLLVIILFCVIGPSLSGYDFEEINMQIKNNSPSREHWFGTDQLGRDLFTRVWRGGRVSILIGVVGAVVSAVIGCIYGGIAAYFGGWVDMIMMRIVEVISSIPNLLLVILISVVLDSKSIGTLMFALLITSWCGLARLVRSEMLRISKSEYVMAARLMGVSSFKIVLTHLIPNCMSTIIVNLTFRIPGLIFAEAFLSYVGLGVQSPETSWGALASAASTVYMFYPYQLVFPDRKSVV